MRKTCLDMVYNLACEDERIVFIGSDLGYRTLDSFKENIPDRFIMEGVSEAHAVGMAAGLALEGKIVYVNTIATFLTRRCFEQNVLDLGLHNLKVRLIGNGGGLVYAPLGPTHLAIDDVAIMRSIPNMTVIAVSDAEEMKRLMPQTVDHPGPIYIRLAKGHDPVVSQPDDDFQIGQPIRRGEGMDGLVITTGVTLRLALEAQADLAKENTQIRVLHCPTIKPLAVKTLLNEITQMPFVVTVEEHTLMGGLGSAVAELMAEQDTCRGVRLRRIGIPDCFAQQYGTQNSLMASYGISTEGIVHQIRNLTASSASVLT